MNIGTMPLALITTYSDEKRGSRPNACAAGYIGQIDETHIAVALRPSRYTYKQARETEAFGVNFLSFTPNQTDELARTYDVFPELIGRAYIEFFEYIKHDPRICPYRPSVQCTQLDDLTPRLKAARYLTTAADYCGSFSGRVVDKFEKTGLTTERVNDVPLIPQCAARAACKLVNIIESPGKGGVRHDLLIGEIMKEYVPTDEENFNFNITAGNYNYRLALSRRIRKIAEDFPRSPFFVTTPDGDVHRNSRFGVVCEQGEQTVFLAYDRKDDLASLIREQKEFVVNVPPYTINNNVVSFNGGKTPIAEARFTAQASKSVSAPSILECRTNLECVVKEEKKLGDSQIFIAQVKKCLADGMIDYCTDLSMDVGRQIYKNEYVIGKMSAIHAIEEKERERLEKLRTRGN